METIPAKNIVNRNKNTFWFGAEYNMNLYKGCNHGCIYCDSRSDCYRVENFDTVRVKENALPILRDNLARFRATGVVATGAMSDPYNPFEKKYEYTRKALMLLDAYGFGAAIATKGSLITRDIDILKEIACHSPTICKITITTPEDGLAAKIEPSAPSSSERFAALEQLAGAGLFCGILLMPTLPFITDTPAEIEKLVDLAAKAGARFIFPAFGMTMRAGQREYFLRKLDENFPGSGLSKKYLANFGLRYQCGSKNARNLWQLFTEACNRYGILYKMQDIVSAYRAPYRTDQLSFF